MNPLFILPVSIIIGVIYMVSMNLKHKSAKEEINIDIERTKYNEHKQKLLLQDFSKLTQWMKDNTIDAFTSASIPQSTKSKVQEFIDDGIKKIALSPINVKSNRILINCFLVLSGNDLHFFKTDIYGELDEYTIFDYFRIEEATMKYGGILKTQLTINTNTNEKHLPKVHIITFDVGGSPLSIEIHDRLNYVVDPSDAHSIKRQALTRMKYQVVGEKLILLLLAKFPNLA